jgi:hypothetical protein
VIVRRALNPARMGVHSAGVAVNAASSLRGLWSWGPRHVEQRGLTGSMVRPPSEYGWRFPPCSPHGPCVRATARLAIAAAILLPGIRGSGRVLGDGGCNSHGLVIALRAHGGWAAVLPASGLGALVARRREEEI